MEVTVFCSEAGGEAEGKLQFSLLQGLGWVTGGRGYTESSGEVFRGFDCVGKRAGRGA